jgi:hypothetical protein
MAVKRHFACREGLFLMSRIMPRPVASRIIFSPVGGTAAAKNFMDSESTIS